MHSFIHWAPRYGVSNKQIGESESERELAVAGKQTPKHTEESRSLAPEPGWRW